MGFAPCKGRRGESGIKGQRAFLVRAFLVEKIWGVFGGIVGAVPKLGQGTREGRNEPVPATLHGSTCFRFIFLKAKVRRCGGVVIDNSDFCFIEGVENGPVEFDQSAIFPKSGRARGVEPKSAGNFGKEVVAIFIGEVAGADFCFHVPTAKGSGGKGEAANFEAHIGNDGKGDPAKVKRVEAGRIRMPDRNFERVLFRGRKEAGLFSRKGNHNRKKVEGGAFFGRGPTKFKAEIGKIGLGRIAQDVSFPGAIAGISAELIIPDAGATPLGVGGRKYGDGRPDIAVVGGVLQVAEAAVVNLLLRLGVTCVQQVEFGPEESANAADAVAPSQPTAVLEFGESERVGSGFLNRLGNLAKAGRGDGGCFFFRLKEAEKSFGGLVERKGLASARETESVGQSKKGTEGHLASLLLHGSA